MGRQNSEPAFKLFSRPLPNTLRRSKPTQGFGLYDTRLPRYIQVVNVRTNVHTNAVNNQYPKQFTGAPIFYTMMRIVFQRNPYMGDYSISRIQQQWDYITQ